MLSGGMQQGRGDCSSPSRPFLGECPPTRHRALGDRSKVSRKTQPSRMEEGRGTGAPPPAPESRGTGQFRAFPAHRSSFREKQAGGPSAVLGAAKTGTGTCDHAAGSGGPLASGRCCPRGGQTLPLPRRGDQHSPPGPAGGSTRYRASSFSVCAHELGASVLQFSFAHWARGPAALTVNTVVTAPSWKRGRFVCERKRDYLPSAPAHYSGTCHVC